MKKKLSLFLFLITGFCIAAFFEQVSASPSQDQYTSQETCKSSYLKIGDCVYKSYGDGRLRIRTSPNIQSNENIIQNLEEGTRMTILSGPRCSSGFLFWKVQTENGVVGYAAEGNGNKRWLILTDAVNCTNVTTGPVTLATSAGQYCPLRDCACSYLSVGDYVTVSNSGPNSIRSDPDLHPSDNIIYRAPVGSGMQIIDGPMCSYGWLVWKVRTDDGIVGYTPESNGKAWWLIPDNNRNNPPVSLWNPPTNTQYNPWYPPANSPVPNVYPEQAASGNCTLLSVSPAFLTSFYPNQETDFSWTVRNDSGVTWTDDTYDIAYIGGTNMLKNKDIIRRDFPYDVFPGNSLSFTVDAVLPSAPGRYTMTYGVVQNYEIVCSMDVTVYVNY